MIYITYEDLCQDIRSHLAKIPRDVAGVVGVPRSGMLPATIIAEFLNVGLTTPDNAISVGTVEAALTQHGGRRLRDTGARKLLVVDDTCFTGGSLARTKKKLESPAFAGYELVFLVVYLEGDCKTMAPDVWLRDVRQAAKTGPFGWALYEWNILAHGRLTSRTLFDLDGVFCMEPPDERNEESYLRYIENPIPLYVPTGEPINICTYRLEKYRAQTLAFLHSIGIRNVNLNMCAAPSYEARRGVPPWQFKADAYWDERWLLFVESSDYQARKIHAVTGKPVLCIETNKVYA